MQPGQEQVLLYALLVACCCPLLPCRCCMQMCLPGFGSSMHCPSYATHHLHTQKEKTSYCAAMTDTTVGCAKLAQ